MSRSYGPGARRRREVPVRGAAWLRLEDEAKIDYRRDGDEDWARFVFFGSGEVESDMSRSTISRCRDLFDSALVEIDTVSDEARAPR